MRRKLHVRRNDTVEIITGADKGRRGRVLATMPDRGRIVVEGANMVWKHVKPSQQRQRGGRIEIEAPLDVSNVMLLCQNRDCQSYDKPVRTRMAVDDKNVKQRVCAKCGEPIAAQQ